MEVFGKVCFAVIAIIFSCLVGGFVFMTLWKWFVAETFALKQLTLIQSVGLMSLINYLRTKQDRKENDKKTITQVFVKALIEVVAYAAVALIFGWFVHQFI